MDNPFGDKGLLDKFVWQKVRETVQCMCKCLTSAGFLLWQVHARKLVPASCKAFVLVAMEGSCYNNSEFKSDGWTTVNQSGQ